MDILRITWLSALSLGVIFALTKLMGNKQISALTFFDYVVGITIGSIAAEMATAKQSDFFEPLVAMVIYAVVSWGITRVTEKSRFMRRIFSGETITLMSEGLLYEKNFKRAKVDINEFLIQSRLEGYFDIGEVEYAFLEANGRITFLPKAESRPLTPKDTKTTVQPEKPFALVVSDGKILKDNLEEIKRDEGWLRKKLSQQNVGETSTVFMACSDGEQIRIYTKQNVKLNNDIFQ